MSVTDNLINKIIRRECLGCNTCQSPGSSATSFLWNTVADFGPCVLIDKVTVQTGLITAVFAMINLALYLAMVNVLLRTPFFSCPDQPY